MVNIKTGVIPSKITTSFSYQHFGEVYFPQVRHYTLDKLVAVSARTVGNILPACTESHGLNPQPRRDVRFKYLLVPLKVCNLLHQMCRSYKIKWSHFETSVLCFVGLMAVSFQWIQWRDWDDKNITRSAHERRNLNSVFYLPRKNQIVVRCCYNKHRYCRNVAAHHYSNTVFQILKIDPGYE